MAKVLILILMVSVISGCSKKNKQLIRAGERSEEEIAQLENLAPIDPQALFLFENKQNPDIIVRPSGLQIRIIKKGTGNIPTARSTVTAFYHGTLTDGTVFDTTRDDGQPFTFPIVAVIKGWQEALYLMQEGAIYQVFIPADLAYGNAGAGTSVPPGATLIFEVELLSVQQPLKEAKK
ncbi:MAG: FKBP-type peptidyl-prolyl cis-trans isomerase [Sphingomonadales bacterium]